MKSVWFRLVRIRKDNGLTWQIHQPPRNIGRSHDYNHDAFWPAHLLKLGMLHQGYIYPKEERSIRDRKLVLSQYNRSSQLGDGAVSEKPYLKMSTTEVSSGKNFRVYSSTALEICNVAIKP